MARLEAGKLDPPIELVGDARSVFDALKASDVCDPAEASLKLHLISVRARLESGLVRKLWWCDTRDMLADALTKGGIGRALLRAAKHDGKHQLSHEVVRSGKQSASKR